MFTLIVDHSYEIYQFTVLLTFLVAIIFFIALYRYSEELKKSMVLEQEANKKLLLKDIELERTELLNEKLHLEQVAKEQKTLRLEQEVTLRNQELVTSTLMLNQQREVLKKIDKEIRPLSHKLEAPEKKVITNLQKMIRQNRRIADDWENFKSHFDQVHPTFFKELTERYPNLTQNEIRHCAYMKMRLNTKEIASLLNINPTSVQIARVRLKKKMELDKKVDLKTYVVNL